LTLLIVALFGWCAIQWARAAGARVNVGADGVPRLRSRQHRVLRHASDASMNSLSLPPLDPGMRQPDEDLRDIVSRLAAGGGPTVP
jgi:hypothetical protein